MQFGKAIGTACASFAITNIDDAFVLVTFFAEASTRKTITPLKITLGQYLGFTVIVVVSMIGFGVSLVLPSEPIGFLGLLPMLLGVWALVGLIFGGDDDDEEDEDGVNGIGEGEGEGEHGDDGQVDRGLRARGRRMRAKFGSLRSVFKVGMVTVINGGDNVGTYIPLFSQAKGAEIAVYVVVYYILMGVWCLAAYLVMKQRHIMMLAQKYADYLVPFLYMGLGIYIVVKSDAYPWSIERIDGDIASHPGKIVMGVSTTGLLLVCICGMVLLQWQWKRKRELENEDDGGVSGESRSERVDLSLNSPSIDDGLSRRTAVETPVEDEQKNTVQTPASGNSSQKRLGAGDT